MNFERIKPWLTWANLVKLIAVLIGLSGLPSISQTVPKAVSATGVPINDLLQSLMPIIAAIATWFGAGWLKTTPELVAAAIGLARNPQDKAAADRFDVACLSMLGARHADNKEVQAAIAQLSLALSNARFPTKGSK